MEKKGYWDAHCHLHLFDCTAGDLNELGAHDETGFFLGGYAPDDFLHQEELKKNWPSFTWLTSVGLHPWWLQDLWDQQGQVNFEANLQQAMILLETYLPQANALGECGVDRARQSGLPLDLQLDLLRRQIDLAAEMKKPLVLHVVRAHSQVLKCLSGQKLPDPRGLVHAFNGSYEIGKAYIDKGFFLSIGPSVLKPGYQKLKQALSRLPWDRLLLETDSQLKGDAVSQGWGNHRPKYDASTRVRLRAVADVVGQLCDVEPARLLASSQQHLQDLLQAQDCDA